nr:MAG TPA: hypothetical protein [Caudoviricetes sp.]
MRAGYYIGRGKRTENSRKRTENSRNQLKTAMLTT